MKLIKVCWYKS